MKRKWISETVGNINPGYIEEAAEYTGKTKMVSPKSRYLWSAMIICSSCFIPACSAA